jgi:hypothetical protein
MILLWTLINNKINKIKKKEKMIIGRLKNKTNKKKNYKKLH